eukprot:gnl/MRDRNA2_/MRDRNA2_75598_c0_seq2.p1 gnl/MRDRNA2_/MRDRNA2_75598_c0~~gnl/MRDRNA2_/MRDRNA2_75598_c0_seq2.p1  ORF type:complete len:125 (-),score=29.63 gnl/MRDRNA2_/MRDRNA2_75598_c0_seq2:215-565(-)
MAVRLDLPMFVALSGAATQRINEFKPEEVASLAWALSLVTWDRLDVPLLAMLANRMERSMDDFKPSGLVIAAWASATMSYSSNRMLLILARLANRCMGDFIAQDVLMFAEGARAAE